MRINIQGGTVKNGRSSLCQSCRHATIVQGLALQHQIIECGRLTSGSARITFPVTSCTGFADRRLPSLREMEEIAWILRTDAQRKQVGFVRAQEMKPEERYVLPYDD